MLRCDPTSKVADVSGDINSRPDPVTALLPLDPGYVINSRPDPVTLPDPVTAKSGVIEFAFEFKSSGVCHEINPEAECNQPRFDSFLLDG